jgi:hypothetical protein
MKLLPLLLALTLSFVLHTPAAINQTLYQTSFEPPAFTPGLPIRGQDGWEMFSDGEAISVSTSNANTGAQSLRMDGALLEPTGPNSARAFCFSRVYLDNPDLPPPPIAELTAFVRLDGPQTGADGAPTNDLMSANFYAVADAGGQGVILGGFGVSSAGRILTVGSRPEDAYKYSAPMAFGAYQKLVLRVDFIARTLRYFANDVELGSVPFAASITSARLASGYLMMAGPIEPLATPYHYDPADYTAWFDDYSIVAIPVEGPEIVVEQPAGNRLTSGAATVDFGSGVVGASSQRTFTIRNIGSEAITGVSVTIDGPNAADFTLAASPATTVDSFGSTTFTVTFSRAVAGTRTASLYIASNDADENPFHIALTGAGVLTPVEIAQQGYIKASNTGEGDAFGNAVAVSGDTMVVGAPIESSNATGVNGNQNNNSALGSGAAYVFVRNGTNWVQQAYLKASNAEADDGFGYSVAIDGDTVIVGAIYEDSNAVGVNGNQGNNSIANSGAAYVFVRSGTNWTQQAYLKSSNPGADDVFGYNVAICRDTIVVGSYAEDSSATGVNGNQGSNSATDSGAVYIFVRSGTNWTQQAYLKASNTGANDSFGAMVAVSGDTLIVGAPGESSSASGVNGNQNDNGAGGAGAAYVFVRHGTNWVQQAYLKASNTQAGDGFGYSVAMDGDTAVVGALYESSNATGVNGNQSNNNALQSGAAYVFVRQGTNWSQQAYLKASNTEAGDEFGASVAVSGDTVLVAAPREDSSSAGVNGNQNNNGAEGSGAVYLFVRTGTNWLQRAYLKASNPGVSDFFGSYDSALNGVAISGDTIVVGAPNEASNATGVNGNQANNSALTAGAAYVFTGKGLVGGPAITTQPISQQVFTGAAATFTVTATSTNLPLRYQWRFQGTDLPGATNETLSIPDAQVANIGEYQVVASDTTGSANSAIARLDLIDALFITAQPSSLAVRQGSNATFAVTAYGTAPLRYLWQLNGADLPGGTNAAVVITNVQAAQLGDYVVVVSNAYGSVTSLVASLTFLTPPTIVAPPQPVTVQAGGNATFSVTVTNTATLPVTYSWRKGSTILTNIVLHSRTCSFTLFNVQTNVTTTNGPGNYRVVVTNAASTGLASPLVALTVQTAAQPPTITAYALLPGGQYYLRIRGTAGSIHTVLGSTNLINWIELGAATETGPGSFEFTDAEAPIHPRRFYRVKQN